MNAIAIEPKPTVLIFEERELVTDEVLGDLDALMAHGELISLFSPEDIIVLIDKLKQLVS